MPDLGLGGVLHGLGGEGAAGREQGSRRAGAGAGAAAEWGGAGEGGGARMAPSIGLNLRVTGHCNQGGRKYMEDVFSVAYQQTDGRANAGHHHHHHL